MSSYPLSPTRVSEPRPSQMASSPDPAPGSVSLNHSIGPPANPGSPAPLQNSVPDHSKFSTPDRAPDPHHISGVFTPSCYPPEELPQNSAGKSLLSPFTPFCNNNLTPIAPPREPFSLSISKRILFTPSRSHTIFFCAPSKNETEKN